LLSATSQRPDVSVSAVFGQNTVRQPPSHHAA
jgi:hypothetical protein